ncbi:hypothetical protein TNCV_2578311 [Trichonephila clavipes]|nr:hypothetical protein TNCV_2578311 [Trichonephila clavipes]
MPTTGVLLVPCHDEFRESRSDYVSQVALGTTTHNTTGKQTFGQINGSVREYDICEGGGLLDVSNGLPFHSLEVASLRPRISVEIPVRGRNGVFLMEISYREESLTRPKQSPPLWSPKMMPIWFYRQDFAKFSLNRHYNPCILSRSAIANTLPKTSVFVIIQDASESAKMSGYIDEMEKVLTNKESRQEFSDASSDNEGGNNRQKQGMAPGG